MDDYEKCLSILNSHENKVFAEMIFNPEKEGNYAMQLMWQKNEDEYYVYPVLIDGATGLIRDFAHAKSIGNYIKFKTLEEADWFSKNIYLYQEIINK